MKVFILLIVSALCVSSFAMNTGTNSQSAILQELMTYISNNPALMQSLIQRMQMDKQQQQQQQQQQHAGPTPAINNNPAGPNLSPVPNMPNMNAMNSNTLGLSLAQRMALSALMKPKFRRLQVLQPRGFFPGGIVVSGDGSDATVRTRFGQLISIEGYKYCRTEFLCVKVI